MLSYIVFSATLICLWVLSTRGLEKAFLWVWIPFFLTMPFNFWVNIPGLPDPNFMQAAILPLLFVLVRMIARRTWIATLVTIIIGTFVIVAQNGTQLIWIVGPYGLILSLVYIGVLVRFGMFPLMLAYMNAETLRETLANPEYAFAAIKARDGEAADAAMRTHLSNSRDRLRKARSGGDALLLARVGVDGAPAFRQGVGRCCGWRACGWV